MSKVHWLALSLVPGIGGATVRRLCERFGCVEAVFDASDEELLGVSRITEEIVARLREVSLDSLEAEIVELADEGIEVLTWDDPEYPSNLRAASDAPPLLFVRGDITLTDEKAMAVIGAREPTPEGEQAAESVARGLAQRGYTIVGGLASGIDTAAHKGALEAPGGRTLAVLGSGIRVIHPRENLELAEAIVERGALISEVHPNTPPSGQNLMARDRIISGLSRAVVVVEAGHKSGSLDTAAKARRQGRLVFAVPGSPGTDELLLSGDAERLVPDEVDFDALCKSTEAPQGKEKNQLSLFGD